jgi:hypothetical protein
VASLTDDQEVTMYDQIAYYSVLTSRRAPERRRAVPDRELLVSRRSRRPRRRVR